MHLSTGHDVCKIHLVPVTVLVASFGSPKSDFRMLHSWEMIIFGMISPNFWN